MYWLVWLALAGVGIGAGMTFVPSLPALLHATRTLVQLLLPLLSFPPQTFPTVNSRGQDVLAGVRVLAGISIGAGMTFVPSLPALLHATRTLVQHIFSFFPLFDPRNFASATHGGVRRTGWCALPLAGMGVGAGMIFVPSLPLGP